jgi:hypothetical protein
MQVDGLAGAGITGGYDQTVVTGSLALQTGSILTIQKTAGFEFGLGQAARIFVTNPGAVSGWFGSAVNAGFTNSVIFNVPTGEVIGLGSYTASSFVQAVSTTTNQSALMRQLLVNTAGGVNQYYGGRLMDYVTAGLAQNAGAVNTAFDRWSPEAYSGIVDHVRESMLSNMSDLGGYEKLEAGRTVAIGSFTRSGSHTRELAGYAKDTMRDNGFNVGFARQWSPLQLQVTFGHTDGNLTGAYLSDKVKGDQVGAGASLPFAFDGQLRATGRYVYGAYSISGDRYANSGKVSIDNVESRTHMYGLGLEYLYSSKDWRIDSTVEWLGMNTKVDSFSEWTAGATQLDTLTVHAQRRNQSLLKADTNIGYNFNDAAAVYLKLGVLQDLDYKMNSLTANVRLESLNITVQNPGAEQTRATAGAGVRFKLFDGIEFNADAGAGTDGSFNFGGGVRYSF